MNKEFTYLLTFSILANLIFTIILGLRSQYLTSIMMFLECSREFPPNMLRYITDNLEVNRIIAMADGAIWTEILSQRAVEHKTMTN